MKLNVYLRTINTKIFELFAFRTSPILLFAQGGTGEVGFVIRTLLGRGRILGRNCDKSLESFPPCFSQSPLLTDPPPPPAKVV
jgi:hypothetical protein